MTALLKRWMALLAISLVAACGGGGGAGTAPFGGTGGSSGGTGTGTGSGTTGSTTTAAPSVVVTISSTNVSSTTPATVTATVTNAAGAPAAGQVVNFSALGALGSFTPASALTDAAGKASVSLSPINTSANGADLAVAKVTVGSVEASGTIGFQVRPTNVTPTGSPSISVTLSTTAVSTATPATLTAVVRDSAGAPVVGQVVKFSTVDSLGTYNVPSALTDASGTVTARLSPATTTSKGADQAVAQVTVNGVLVTGSIGFSVTSTTATVVGTPSISLSLSTTVVTASSPATVSATVRDATGAGVAGQVVKFGTVDGLGSFSVASALTDGTGQATVTLTATAAGSGGADQVVATTTVNGTPLQASQGFQLTVPNVTISAFSSDLNGSQLSAYGQTNLTVTIAGSVTGSPVQVSLTSACVAKGKATLTPASLTTTTGSATFTYRDTGCGATDLTDALQASLSGGVATRTLSVGLTSPTVSSISFASATPSTIYLKGSGLTETSTVIFRVLDTAGNGLPNQSVRLEPTTLTGGLTLDGGSTAVTKLSDSLGNVTALINSGTVPTPVRIKATLVSSAISTVSSALSIAVGLPSQLNFSLAQQTINIEGFDIDGTPNVYSIIASDRLANPVPAGTAINFVAEGGQIESNKLTALTNGLARTSANFVSAAPRPADGRVTVLAYALGEESFLDENGSNVYERTSGSGPVREDFQDLGNVYLSRKFDGVYDSANDQFIALALPGSTAASGSCNVPSSTLLAGSIGIPSVPGTCDGVWGRAYVRRAVETVFSRSSSRPVWLTAPTGKLFQRNGSCNAITLSRGYDATGANLLSTFYPIGGGDLYGMNRSGVLSFLASDNNPVRLNPMAAGTVITVSGNTGLSVSVAGGSPVPSTSEASSVSLNYAFPEPSATSTVTVTSGTITVTFTSPSGTATTVTQNIAMDAAPAGLAACP